LKKYQSNHF